MNLPDIKNDLLRKLFIERPGNSPDYVLDDVLHAINSAGQLLNSIGFPFWAKETIDLKFSHIIPERVLDARKVEVVRSKSTGLALQRASSRAQVKQWESIFESAEGNYNSAGYQSARVFFSEAEVPSTLKQVRLRVGPSPLLEQTVTVEYVPVFERYTRADMENESVSVAVPSDYVETLFLPIARYFATRSHFFSHTENFARLEDDYRQAVSMLQAVNPELSMPTPPSLPQPRQRKENAE
jgi:hypothetical protein